MKLQNMKEITGTIILKSGLHIGAGDMEMKIGGTDNPVVKHPHTMEPFIPGSSFKGKVRSLMELRSGLMGKSEGKPLAFSHLAGCGEPEMDTGRKILKLFGTSGADDESLAQLGPTRAAFADAFLNVEWKKEADENHLTLFEVKSENSINRIKGTAENPRFTERVTAGCRFDFCIGLKAFEGDDGLEDFLLEGLRLLQMDSLGGNGSRGYGKIELRFDDKDLQERFEQITPL